MKELVLSLFLLTLGLIAIGCAVNKSFECCYGTPIPEGYTCINQETDCQDDNCTHFTNCNIDTLRPL